MSAPRARPWRRRAEWIALALAGLAVTAALAIAASQLTVERVGLAGESPAVSAHLAPASPTARQRSPRPSSPTHPRPDERDGADD